MMAFQCPRCHAVLEIRNVSLDTDDLPTCPACGWQDGDTVATETQAAPQPSRVERLVFAMLAGGIIDRRIPRDTVVMAEEIHAALLELERND